MSFSEQATEKARPESSILAIRPFKARRPWLVLLTLPVILSVLPAWGQRSVSQLEQQLQAAVAQSNWASAVQIVDRLIPLVPGQASQLKQYRAQLEQLSRNSVSKPTQLQTAAQPQGLVPIKRRSNGVPVIDVMFNQRKTFEMMVDSGASITTITRPMAAALGIGTAQITQYATFKTANGSTKMPIAFLKAVTVGGLTATQIPVAIAGPDMEMGLLGQDFLQRYDVSLRGSRIEFHDRR
ncbi:TIGR02281 family clan AA aspartic protease [Altericista sp. CCNU0014]|uniref:retropepsin-like aspartic protease family protein n=1 Tax=Altericista sp. CCNU0014 TaxID=3082949 RepID=UPI00384E0556